MLMHNYRLLFYEIRIEDNYFVSLWKRRVQLLAVEAGFTQSSDFYSLDLAEGLGNWETHSGGVLTHTP
jgi:hypothetical protein